MIDQHKNILYIIPIISNVLIIVGLVGLISVFLQWWRDVE